jgi:Ankyrin repeats (3 copies)
MSTTQTHINQTFLNAARVCDVESIQSCLAAGANVNVVSKRGRSALMYAVVYTPKSADEERTLPERKRRILDSLFETPGIRVNLQDDAYTQELIYSSTGGNTALMLAVRYGYTECVQRLLDVPGIDVYRKNHEDRDALNLAILFSNYAIFQLFRDRGFYTLNDIHEGFISLIDYTYPSEDTYRLMDELMKYPGFDVNYSGFRGSPVLHSISDGEYVWTTILKLLRHPKIDVNVPFPDGETALIRACYFPEPQMVRLLLTSPTADVLKPTKRGRNLWSWIRNFRSVNTDRPYRTCCKLIKRRIQSSIEVRAITEIGLFSPLPYLPAELQTHIGGYLLKRDTIDEVLEKYPLSPDTTDSESSESDKDMDMDVEEDEEYE